MLVKRIFLLKITCTRTKVGLSSVQKPVKLTINVKQREQREQNNDEEKKNNSSRNKEKTSQVFTPGMSTKQSQ